MNRIKNHFNRSENLIIFLIILIGVLCPLFSGRFDYNFFVLLNSVFTSPVSIICLFISSVISIYKFIVNDNYLYILNRFKGFKAYVLYYFKDVIYSSSYLFIIFVLLGVSGCFLFCFNNFRLVMYSYYNIHLISYLFFLIVREFIIFNILNLVIYFIILFNNKYVSSFMVVCGLCLFYLVRDYKDIVNGVFNMYISFPCYFMNIEYSSFLTEILCSIIEIFLLIFICFFIYRLLIRKKRDLL